MKSLLAYFLFAILINHSIAQADALFDCSATQIVDASIIGESLDTKKNSSVAGAQEDGVDHIFLGVMLIVDGEYGFSIHTIPTTEPNHFDYRIDHTAGLQFFIHGNHAVNGEEGVGQLTVKSVGDSSETLVAVLKCE